jgi:hypothetical protein
MAPAVTKVSLEVIVAATIQSHPHSSMQVTSQVAKEHRHPSLKIYLHPQVLLAATVAIAQVFTLQMSLYQTNHQQVRFHHLTFIIVAAVTTFVVASVAIFKL